jgi:predicted phosphate transport protein (TIGR00153 family)
MFFFPSRAGARLRCTRRERKSWGRADLPAVRIRRGWPAGSVVAADAGGAGAIDTNARGRAAGEAVRTGLGRAVHRSVGWRKVRARDYIRKRSARLRVEALLHSRASVPFRKAPMFGRLLPREGRFFDLFNAHAAQVVRAASELSALMRDYSQLEERARIIDEAEHAADRITAETVRLLHQTFITPLDRDHIHQLINGLDDICDLIQDTAQTFSLYDIKKITPETERLADIGTKCCERVKDVVGLLGDKAGRFEAILKTCEEIDRLESDADRVMRAAVSRLFREEQDVREIIKMKAIYELLEAVTDRCLDVANLSEGIALENK